MLSSESSLEDNFFCSVYATASEIPTGHLISDQLHTRMLEQDGDALVQKLQILNYEVCRMCMPVELIPCILYIY